MEIYYWYGKGLNYIVEQKTKQNIQYNAVFRDL